MHLRAETSQNCLYSGPNVVRSYNANRCDVRWEPGSGHVVTTVSGQYRITWVSE